MAAFIAIVLGVIGLLMSTCGLLFIGLSMPNDVGGVAFIAVPSIVIGGGLLWAGIALWKSWRRAKSIATTQARDHEPPQ